MLYSDGNGFPLTLKPSHLFGSTERMDVAEVLAAIVEKACLYVPETPVGIKNVKRLKALTEVKVPKALTEVKVPKEALTDSEKASPIEERTSVEKKVLVSSNLVRIK